jgi:Na+/H+ antiporter NhaD/arsenite permease-like protein
MRSKFGRAAVGGVVVVLGLPRPACAAEGPLDVPLWSAAPFVLLLLAIAVLPLVAEHFWHRNLSKALVAAVLALPVVAYLETIGGRHALLHEVGQYVSFIVLLGALYTVSGGIVLRGDIRARPLTNAAFLAVGAVLANLIGTTGASMLLIRPVLRINKERQNTRHLPIFFIFLVSNLGGLLTPLGDPPLFLGFLNGIDFFWTVRLWPQWLLANGLVLAVFLVWDTVAYLREPSQALAEDRAMIEPLRVEGLVNVLFLAGILVAVLLHAEKVSGEVTGWVRQFYPACPDLTLRQPWGQATVAAMGLLSLLCTRRRLRQANGFTWGPIAEVAILFAGIFVTMVPALEWLRLHGHEFGVTRPWQFFWLTGGLSSFLDNAPTYMVFATLAAGGQPLSSLQTEAPLLLAAVSCGAVFMGANTYIGNGPNFMVKAIADEAGYKMPSFFGYMLYSCVILLPIFVLVTWLFFRR